MDSKKPRIPSLFKFFSVLLLSLNLVPTSSLSAPSSTASPRKSSSFVSKNVLVQVKWEKNQIEIQQLSSEPPLFTTNIMLHKKKKRQIKISRALAMEIKSRLINLLWDMEYKIAPKKNSGCESLAEINIPSAALTGQLCRQDFVNVHQFQKLRAELLGMK